VKGEHEDLTRFRNVTFEDFRRLAQDDSLTSYQKIGFPVSYRKGREKVIFSDIVRKLPQLRRRGGTVLDIGPGCSDLPFLMIELCRKKGHRLILVDSKEMLDHLPDELFVEKIEARYPDGCSDLLRTHGGSIDAILSYSVLQYVFAEASAFDFIDRSLELLAAGGGMLIGDIPNMSMRRRFLTSEAGIRYHKRFMRTNEPPDASVTAIKPGDIDDAVVLSLLQRCRSAGFDAYLVPQAPGLPMANRREDILIIRP
jgi:hypothetical protein